MKKNEGEEIISQGKVGGFYLLDMDKCARMRMTIMNVGDKKELSLFLWMKFFLNFLPIFRAKNVFYQLFVKYVKNFVCRNAVSSSKCYKIKSLASFTVIGKFVKFHQGLVFKEKCSISFLNIRRMDQVYIT